MVFIMFFFGWGGGEKKMGTHKINGFQKKTTPFTFETFETISLGIPKIIFL